MPRGTDRDRSALIRSITSVEELEGFEWGCREFGNPMTPEERQTFLERQRQLEGKKR